MSLTFICHENKELQPRVQVRVYWQRGMNAQRLYNAILFLLHSSLNGTHSNKKTTISCLDAIALTELFQLFQFYPSVRKSVFYDKLNEVGASNNLHKVSRYPCVIVE